MNKLSKTIVQTVEMNPPTKEREKSPNFMRAAAILHDNRKDTRQYADRMKGITNGNSDLKKKALADLLSR